MKKSIEFWIARGKGKYSHCVVVSLSSVHLNSSGCPISYIPAIGQWIDCIDWFDYDQWPKLKPGEIRKIRMEIVK